MKKGFTLIELLAVIVILAVLALIATPIVLNIIDDSKKNATLRSSENYIKAVEFSIAKSVMENKRLADGNYPIMSNGNICLGTKSGNTCDNELIVEVSGETPESGTVTIKSRKIDSYEFTYASGFVVVNGSISDDAKVCKLTLDEDKDGIADLGDMITCSTESFYVIENDREAISMLAQYNLNVGDNKYPNEETYGLQDKNVDGNTYGGIAFSNTKYWYDVETGDYIADIQYVNGNPFIYGDYKDSNGEYLNNLYPYVEAYEEFLIDEGVKSADGTLLDFSYISRLNLMDGICGDTTSNYPWVMSISYWTGSSFDDTGNYNVAFVSSVQQYSCDDTETYNSELGIRPIINISVSEL